MNLDKLLEILGKISPEVAAISEVIAIVKEGITYIQQTGQETAPEELAQRLQDSIARRASVNDEWAKILEG